jgi:short-subunit dehydrogenase
MVVEMTAGAGQSPGAVVIAGASSGIGLATALAFARRGAALMLVARRAEALEDAARRCVAAGSPHVMVFPADVADAAALRAVAAQVLAECGSLDVWVNMAGVAALGRFEEIPLEVQARVIETNLIGAMNGAYAAAGPMLRQGRGVIINMSSIGGRIAQPFTAAYTASKFGLAGFTDALRQELLARSAVQVCGVYPQFVDTPAPLHTANYSGRAVRPMPPVSRPEWVAERIVALALRPRRALHLGAAHAFVPIYALMPETAMRWLGRVFMWLIFRTGPHATRTNGAVLAPMAEGTTTAIGWGMPRQSTVVRWGAMACGAVTLGFWLARRAGPAGR